MSEFNICAYLEFDEADSYLICQIVYPNGERSNWCYTKWQAKQMVYSLRNVTLDDAEVKVIVEMVDNSEMLESDTDLENHTANMADIFAKIDSGLDPAI